MVRTAMSQCNLNPFLKAADAMSLPEWFVAIPGGQKAVGPVSAVQIAEGIKRGHVPSDARVARKWVGNWEEVLESKAVLDALKAY
jgi:hypothetical protein